MAERRMFSKTVVESDAFLDMPSSTQALYLHLGMNADDDGFLNAPKRIQRESGASDDDIKLLIAKGFLIPFESGVVVIRHWKVNNYIQKDRYRKTICKKEESMLSMNENREYVLNSSEQLQIAEPTPDLTPDPKPEKKAKRFVKPTVEQVRDYITEKNYTVDAEKFWDYYESKGWKVGHSPMKDWKAAVRTWQSNYKQWGNQQVRYREEEQKRVVIDNGYDDLISAL